MPQIDGYEGVVAPKKTPKRMLEVLGNEQDGYEVNINYSSLELMQTCMRKADYNLNQGWVSAESEALIFGSAVHKGIEVWYMHPRQQRLRVTPQCMDYQIDKSADLEHGESCARCAAVWAFKEEGDALRLLAPDNKRSIENGVDILNNYFDEYLQDSYEVVRMDDGTPMIECHAQHRIYDGWKLKINYHGTIDLVLRDTITGEICVTDHKTTWQLGQDFYNRLKPNHQYTGYVWLANRAFGLATNRFMINGIQVAKTKRGLARQFTSRNEEDFLELRNAVVFNVKKYLECMKDEVWPQNSPNPCTMYGGCGYRGVCDLPENMRPNALEASFQRREV